MTNKEKLLTAVLEEITRCLSCRKNSLGIAVAGEGNANAHVVFVGEAPGKREAMTGKPFVGRSGGLLRQAIRDIGLSEKEVFITSVVKYLPKQGTPSMDQIIHGKGHLEKQLSIIKPQIIVLLGRVAVLGVLGEALSVAKEHGTWREKEGTTYFISYHPAAALRFPQIRKVFLQDMDHLKEKLKEG